MNKGDTTLRDDAFARLPQSLVRILSSKYVPIFSDSKSLKDLSARDVKKGLITMPEANGFPAIFYGEVRFVRDTKLKDRYFGFALSEKEINRHNYPECLPSLRNFLPIDVTSKESGLSMALQSVSIGDYEDIRVIKPLKDNSGYVLMARGYKTE